MKTSLQFILLIIASNFIISCGGKTKDKKGSESISIIDKKGIIAEVDGKKITTSDYTSHITLNTSSGLALALISGVTDDLNQFQLQVITKNEENIIQTHGITSDDVLSISLNYMEYKIPEDPTSIETWRAVSGEITISKMTKTRCMGTFNCITKNKEQETKSIKGSFNVKRNQFGS